MTKPTLIVDNGSYSIKAGFAANADCQEVPNCIVRSRDRITYVGKQLHTLCKDYSQLVIRRPFEKGQLVSFEAEKALWDYTFFSEDTNLNVSPKDTNLILTESCFTLPSLSANVNQIVFEEYGFESLYKCPAGNLVRFNDYRALNGGNQAYTDGFSDFSLVVDCGFSFTSFIPIVNGEVVWKAVKRMNVAGKMLTNLLKENISYKYYNVMDETFLINNVKESLCYVSRDYIADLNKFHSLTPREKKIHELRKDYLLPDYKTTLTGYPLKKGETPKGDQQILSLLEERFMIPEYLFSPNVLHLNQAGIPEAIAKVIDQIPDEVHRSLLYSNIVLVGGTSRLPGYRERVYNDLLKLTPQRFKLNVSLPENPITYAWKGGQRLAQDTSMYSQLAVTREEYFESGEAYCQEKFFGHYVFD